MTTITGTQPRQPAANPAAANGAGAAAAGGNGPADSTDTAAGTEDRFLKLLVAQMRNQDPLNPLDNAQVTSQLAQINTVRGIEQLNSSMATMAAASSAVSPVSAVGLLGRQVLIGGQDFEWSREAAQYPNPDPSMPDTSTEAGKSVRLGFELPAAARAVRAEIVDSTGQVVFAHDATDAEPGVHSFAWDGRNAEGKAMGDGKYRLRVFAAGYDGAELQIDPLVPARVTGVAQAPAGARVELGNRPSQPASAIRAIL